MKTNFDRAPLTPSKHESVGYLDTAGIIASWLCAVHCIVLPMFISVLPLIGLSFLLDETTEAVFIAATVAIALLSILPAYFRQHGKLMAIILFVNGLFLIVLSHIILIESFAARAILLVGGGALISAAHLVNRRLCRECVRCQETHAH